jgi:uncharacterized membrane-anchored protein YhcB (DUF1043 family)
MTVLLISVVILTTMVFCVGVMIGIIIGAVAVAMENQ